MNDFHEWARTVGVLIAAACLIADMLLLRRIPRLIQRLIAK